MAGYKRPLSRGELRYIYRQRMRAVVWSALLVLFALAFVIAILYGLHTINPP